MAIQCISKHRSMWVHITRKTSFVSDSYFPILTFFRFSFAGLQISQLRDCCGEYSRCFDQTLIKPLIRVLAVPIGRIRWLGCYFLTQIKENKNWKNFDVKTWATCKTRKFDFAALFFRSAWRQNIAEKFVYLKTFWSLRNSFFHFGISYLKTFKEKQLNLNGREKNCLKKIVKWKTFSNLKMIFGSQSQSASQTVRTKAAAHVQDVGYCRTALRYWPSDGCEQL